MKTMLIPVDFTGTSDNTIRYALDWCRDYGYEHIILLKTVYNSIFDNLIPSDGYMHVNREYGTRERDDAQEQLDRLCRSVSERVVPGVKISRALSDLPLLRSILEVVEDEKPQLLVIGTDNFSYSSDSFIAGNAIEIARVSPVRVLIVPAHYRYQPIREALVPCDFNAVSALEKIDSYQASSPQWREKKLVVLNVDPKERYLRRDENFLKAENALHHYLRNFHHEVQYSSDRNIFHGIKAYLKEHDVQLVIALQGRYSFLYSLTHSSIAEAIYRNAQKPVLILK